MNPTEIVDWFQLHAAALTVIAGVAWLVLSGGVALTPTQEDDQALARLAQRVSFLKPANVDGKLSVPGVRHAPEPEDP
jgi:hypothetical protein